MFRLSLKEYLEKKIEDKNVFSEYIVWIHCVWKPPKMSQREKIEKRNFFKIYKPIYFKIYRLLTKLSQLAIHSRRSFGFKIIFKRVLKYIFKIYFSVREALCFLGLQ